MSKKKKKTKNPKLKSLQMTFDPNTIEHLGVRMYSTLPPVIAELIANSYDADEKNVCITLNDKADEKEIIVSDDGIGMTFKEINDDFLRIGKNRIIWNKTDVTAGGRKVIGKKGLGKLSFFGIAGEIEISTVKDGKENVFSMVWEDIKKEKHNYKPKIIKRDAPCSSEKSGTLIKLKKIQRKTDFSGKDLASNLSKIFIVDPDFQISVNHNSGEPVFVSNELRYEDLEKEVQWDIPKDYEYSGKYEKADIIKGHLIAAKRPISPKTNMRGITLFSRKKLVNLPEYFSDSTSSHFFSYLTGQLEVDFIYDFKDDVIATNRQSLNWGHDETKKLREYLRDLINWLERDWRKKREKRRKDKLSESSGINIADWLSKIPDDYRGKIEPIIESYFKDSELPEETNIRVVKNIHDIVPEYPLYHWRHLHPEIQNASEKDYRNRDYYRAFQEAVKRYINEVKTKSGSTNTSDYSMMGEVFGNGSSQRSLRVAQNFRKPNGVDFNSLTINNIEDGQKHLSMGVVSGCRNPVSHEEISDLRDSGLFTEKDCLDALSLLSHLFSRLENIK